LEREDRHREGSKGGRNGAKERQAGYVPDAPRDKLENKLELPDQTPLYHAEQAARYDRQALIQAYQAKEGCRLVVVIDAIFGQGITLFEELIYDADPKQDLHILLDTPGGDGETAVRLVRAAQARCKELTVIVPDQAKSAGTLLVMGAHRILMGPTSDLGPVDPQFPQPDGTLISAKDIIAAVDDAAKKVQAAPATYPIYAALLGDVSALKVQQARSALARSADLVEEALSSNPDRSEKDVKGLKAKLKAPLIEAKQTHAAIFGAKDASNVGLPVEEADPASDQWKMIWRLWAKYFALMPLRVYEGEKASKTIPLGQLQ
jgi:hypothetical protein